MNYLVGRGLRRILDHAPGIIVGFIMAFMCPLLNAQEYPTKPVRIIVPVSPGGATDMITRTLGSELSNMWGRQVIVDNRPGASGNIGFAVAAKAQPDGYTLLMAPPQFAVNVSLYRNVPYNPLRDFSAVCLVATTPNVLVVHPSVPANSVKELIALAKARPGKLTYVSSGSGTTLHLSGELFKRMAGVDILHAPYKSATLAMSDLMSGGYVDLGFFSLVTVISHINAKRLRAVAVTSRRRSALMPDLPTFDEAGLPGYEVMGWFGVVAPKGTPHAIITRLNTDIAKALTSPGVIKTMRKVDLDPAEPNSPAEFSTYLQEEISKWAATIKAAGATVD